MIEPIKVPLKVYVGTKDDVPLVAVTIVAVTTNKHRAFSKKAFDELLDTVESFAFELREQWDEKDWFPCGFVYLKVEGNSPLVKFLKKEGEDGCYRILRGSKDYRRGWSISLDMPDKDAISSQCMKYKQRVFEKLQFDLAYLGIRASIETMVD